MGQPFRKQVVQNHAQRIDVRAGVDLLRPALLGVRSGSRLEIPLRHGKDGRQRLLPLHAPADAAAHDGHPGLERVVSAEGPGGLVRLKQRLHQHILRVLVVAARAHHLAVHGVLVARHHLVEVGHSFEGFTEILAGIAVAGIVWYGGTSVIAGTRTQGDFFSFVITLFLLYEPFKRLVKTVYTIQTGLAGADRVFELLDTPSLVVDRPGATPLAGMRQGIAFEDVAYGDVEPPMPSTTTT